MKRTIRLRESELIDMINRIIKEQQDYTFSPSDSTVTNDEPRVVPGLDNCGAIMSFIDQKITEMLNDKRSKEYIAQMLASNVKLENLSPERQDQIDPYGILRSDTVKKLRAEKGTVSIQRLLSDCSKKFSFHKNAIKNKSIFKMLKIDVIDMPDGGGDNTAGGAQCGRPNWGRASRSCMKPIFSGPHGITFGGMRSK